MGLAEPLSREPVSMSYRSQSDDQATPIESLTDIVGVDDILQRLAVGELGWIRTLSTIGERQILLLERLLDERSSMHRVAEYSGVPAFPADEDEVPVRDADVVNDLVARAERSEQELAEAREEIERLEQRLQMALDDLRDAKRLESERALREPAGESPADAIGLDWETQKKQLLSRWDQQGSDANQKGEIQRIIAETDEIIRRKDEEIRELQRLLQQQSENIGGMAIGAAAIEGLLETDELIRQERERLETLQAQWREKFRQAEIETSMERAKLARERRELESRLEELKRDQARWAEERAAFQAELQSNRQSNAPRNRWFNRLGLRDGDDR